MSRRNLGFIDSTLRDGQEALLGGRLRIELASPILESLDNVGFESIEAWGGGTFRSSLVLLHKDPWETLRFLKKEFKRTPFQMFIRGRFLVGSRPFSYGFIERFLTRTAQLGVNVVRLVDPLNDLESLTKVAYIAKKAGLIVQLSVLCSDLSDNLDYYRHLISKTDLSSADALGMFDPWGTLSSATAIKIIELLQKRETHRIFAHLHNLRNAGQTARLAAMEKGISIVDTCFSAFSCNGSLPSIETLFGGFTLDGVFNNLDLEALLEASNGFVRLRNEYFDRVPAAMRPVSQMEKNLHEIAPTFSSVVKNRSSVRQSTDVGGLREEALRIMNELGLVALMAPVSEIVARQAVLNLHSKTRYADFTDEFLRLLRGEYGGSRIRNEVFKEANRDEERQNLVGTGRIEERIPMPPDQQKIGEDDVLSFALHPRQFIEFMQAGPIVLHGGRQKVAAATLAFLAEKDKASRPTVMEESLMRTVVDSSRWRDGLRLEDSDLSRKHGFVEEPF